MAIRTCGKGYCGVPVSCIFGDDTLSPPPPPPRLAKQGATVGEDTVSGLMFAEDFVGISETPERLQKQREKALLIEYTRKRRVTAIAYLRKYGRI